MVYGGAQSLVRHGRPNVVDSLEVDRVRAKQDLEAAKARRDTDEAQLRQIADSIERLEAKGFELERLERQRNLIEQNYSGITKVLDARRFQEEVNAQKTASVRIIQPAESPVDAGNLRAVILVGGALLALFAGVVTAALSGALRIGYLSPEKIERSLNVPVLASIPLLARAGSHRRRREIMPPKLRRSLMWFRLRAVESAKPCPSGHALKRCGQEGEGEACRAGVRVTTHGGDARFT